MSDWWLGVEEALAAHSAHAPDPWAQLADELPVLTDQQRSFLEQIAAQPQPARLSQDDLDNDDPDNDDPDNDDPDNDDDWRESSPWRVGRRPDEDEPGMFPVPPPGDSAYGTHGEF